MLDQVRRSALVSGVLSADPLADLCLFCHSLSSCLRLRLRYMICALPLIIHLVSLPFPLTVLHFVPIGFVYLFFSPPSIYHTRLHSFLHFPCLLVLYTQVHILFAPSNFSCCRLQPSPAYLLSYLSICPPIAPQPYWRRLGDLAATTRG